MGDPKIFNEFDEPIDKDLGYSVDMPFDIKSFHQKFELEPLEKPGFLPDDLAQFRLKTLFEEINEYSEAVDKGELDKAFDALIDLVYFALGTAYLHRFPFAEGWVRVQLANMAKVRSMEPKSNERGGGYDIIKPEGWTPPDLSDLVV